MKKNITTENDHTPGPWSVKQYESGKFLREINGPEFDQIAYFRGPINWPVQEANARLMAAAPEMLAALQRQYENIQQWLAGGPAAGPDESREIAEQIRYAIEKATMPVVSNRENY